MENIKDKSTKELAFRLNEIIIQRDKLDLEYNTIIRELWDRIPSLTSDPNLQLRKKR